MIGVIVSLRHSHTRHVNIEANAVCAGAMSSGSSCNTSTVTMGPPSPAMPPPPSLASQLAHRRISAIEGHVILERFVATSVVDDDDDESETVLEGKAAVMRARQCWKVRRWRCILWAVVLSHFLYRTSDYIVVCLSLSGLLTTVFRTDESLPRLICFSCCRFAMSLNNCHP